MAVKKATRLSKIAREFNVGISTIVDFLNHKGHKIDSNPNTKIEPELYDILVKEYSSDISMKKESEKVALKNIREKKESISLNDIQDEETVPEQNEADEEIIVKDLNAKKDFSDASEKKIPEKKLKVVGKIDVDKFNKKPKKEEKEETPKEEPKAESKEQSKEKEQVPITKEEPKAKKIETPKEEPSPEPEIEEQISEDSAEAEHIKADIEKLSGPTVVGKIDLASMNQRVRPKRKTKEEKEEERKQRSKSKAKDQDKAESTPEGGEGKAKTGKADFIKSKVEKLNGPTVVGKIDLPEKEKDGDGGERKGKRKRIKKERERVSIDKNERSSGDKKDFSKKSVSGKKKRRVAHNEVNEEDVEKQIKDTLARLTSKGKSKGSKHRREKREAQRQELEKQEIQKQQDKNIIKVSEFVSVSELANMMSVAVNEVIATCMNLGLIVSINQRLDAETMALVADEFNFKFEFVSAEIQEHINEEEDTEDDLEVRPPIVTVMGHVDHGKTKLLDHIRSSNVIAGEAGGITQHIGAYSVQLENGRQITFLDTPGHEAFTAMRARGAQITDVAIIVVAADDGVKPQTVEAINHASAAGVPIVFAINKIDKPTANPDKIKEALAGMNYLVEDWGGKYQSQDISAKNGLNIEDLLDKVLLESDLLELKANPNKRAVGTIIESTLDKGRGYTVTALVEAGTLRIGDIMLAGINTGRVKAMFNERGNPIAEAGPSTPAVILGLNGAPQAGDRFNVLESEREAREIANKREQLQREQGLRAHKHITLDEIGRRIAIGNFQELNILVKGDVDGSIEALSDSLIKLSTEEIQVNIIHKAVGQISESDVLLAAASDAIIIGFQVRPSMSARRLAEKEEIDIRIYSIIYDAIENVKAAMEGMLSPEIKEEIIATVEVRETFKITKVGTIAGCMVKEGKITRSSKVRIIRDGIVIYTGVLGSLKRFKDDVKEVANGYECGLNIANFNDIKVGDIVEAYTEIEVAKKL